jgi:DNA-binding transcriptional MerR regulator
LLNSPGVRGPGAKYGEADLNRLRYIKKLKKEHLPLAEIRRQLEALDDEGVKAALREMRQSRESAADYARSVLNPIVKYSQRAADLPGKALTGNTLRATWERIEIAPDIELHVRRPLSRYENKRLEQAIDHLTRFLNEEDNTWP